MNSLAKLAELLRSRNEIDREIGAILGRPVHPGHFGEYVAAAIFGIELYASAVHKGSDGLFKDGQLKGKSVNIKYGTKQKGMLNLISSAIPEDHPDYYLVLSGPKSGSITSKNTHALWVISSVHLFSSHDLLAAFAERPEKMGVATSVRKQLWESAELFPECRNPNMPIRLSSEQIAALSLFSPLAE